MNNHVAPADEAVMISVFAAVKLLRVTHTDHDTGLLRQSVVAVTRSDAYVFCEDRGWSSAMLAKTTRVRDGGVWVDSSFQTHCGDVSKKTPAALPTSNS